MDIGLEVSELDGWTVVSVSGEVDLYSAPDLRSTLAEMLETGRVHLVVDLTWVEFIDSSGLGVLIGTFKRARNQGGEVRVVVDDPRVKKVFEVTSLDRVFRVGSSVSEVVAP